MTKKTEITTKDDIKKAELLHQIVLMKKKGFSTLEIANELSVSPEYAHKLYTAYYNKLMRDCAETVDQSRQLELDRLDELTKVFLPLGMTGDIAAAEFFIKLSKHRSQILGLNKPKEVNITNKSQNNEDLSKLSTEELKDFIKLKNKTKNIEVIEVVEEVKKDEQ